MELNKKYFACPECGAKYKILFNGKKYKCKQCNAPFQVPNLIENSGRQQYNPPNIKHETNSKSRKNYKTTIIFLAVTIGLIFVICQISNYYSPYNTGIRLFNGERFELAIAQFKKIRATDSNYKDAQDKIIIIQAEFEAERLRIEAQKERRRLNEISDIEKKLKSIPHSEYKQNYELYAQLSILDSNNLKYQYRRDNYQKLHQNKVAYEKRTKQARLNSAIKKLKKKHDDVSGVTWYYQRYFTHYTNTNLTSIYIGKNTSSVWLRLQMSYHGDDWIFFDKAYLSYDGNTIEIFFNKYKDKETESKTDVWEWIDISVSKRVETFLRSFAKSKNAKMRLSGKYTRTRKLTWNERQGIRDILDGYDALNKLE